MGKGFRVVWALLVLAAGAGIAGSGMSASATTFPGFNGRIAFQSDRDGNEDIYVVNPNGTGSINLTAHPASDVEPRWSPDGRRILFASNRDGNYELYVMDADGGGITRLTNNAVADRSPAWSPNGNEIVFARAILGQSEIFLMNMDGSGAVNLSNNAATDANPVWAPDGSRIAWQTNRDGNFEIYSVAAAGGVSVNLTNNSGNDIGPSWSPDSRKILFSSDRVDNGRGDIFVMERDGANPKLVPVSGVAADTRAAFSPNGGRMVFASNRLGGDFELFTISILGRDDPDFQLVRTTRANGIDQAPDWQPMSARLVASGPDTVAADAAAGDSVTTDTTGDGPAMGDVVETTVTVPGDAAILIDEQPTSSIQPTDVDLAGGDVNVTAPEATPDSPLRLFFAIDISEVPADATEQDAVVYRNGTEVPLCMGAGPTATATPDPCVVRRGKTASGDVFIVVLTSRASTWNAGLRPPRQFGSPGPSQVVVTDPPCAFEPAGCTPTPTTSSTPSPSPTLTPGPPPLLLESSKSIVAFGRSVTLSGRIPAASEGCVAQRQITIRRTDNGQSEQVVEAETTTDTDGNFAVAVAPRASATFTASIDETAQCGPIPSSTPLPIDVKVAVGLGASGGKRSVLTAVVSPCGDHAETVIRLQKKKASGFKTIAKAVLSSACRAKFVRIVGEKSTFKAYWRAPRGHVDHLSGKSRPLLVR